MSATALLGNNIFMLTLLYFMLIVMFGRLVSSPRVKREFKFKQLNNVTVFFVGGVCFVWCVFVHTTSGGS